MKYFKRSNVYKASNVSFHPDTISAYSYGWWKFVASINGTIIFNNYSYSSSTCKHQYKVRRLLEQLGIVPDLYIEAPKGLQDLSSAIRYYEQKIDYLNSLINKKGTRKLTNLKRLEQIKEFKGKIIQVERILNPISYAV